MDREILFREKRLDNGEWAEGAYMKHIRRTLCPVWDRARPDDIEHLIIFNDSSDWNMPASIRCVQIDPATVGQYIGLADKNGVKIFEGDILGSHYDEEYPENVTIEVVVWSENGWGLEIPGGDLAPVLEDGELPYSEVVGNIHDNPELLEEVTP